MRTLALAFAVALPMALAGAPALGQEAAAKAKTAKAAEAKAGPNQKVCRSKRPDGSVKTWTCGKDQPCCVSHTFNLYTCGSQLLKCF